MTKQTSIEQRLRERGVLMLFHDPNTKQLLEDAASIVEQLKISLKDMIEQFDYENSDYDLILVEAKGLLEQLDE